MTETVGNPQWFDPYKTFKFRVQWDGRIVAGISKVSGLRRTTEVITHREGGDPSAEHKSPGRTEFEPLVLERGVTHDPSFELWVNNVWPTTALEDFRKNVRIEMLNEAGQLVGAWDVFRCWPSEYQVLPELDANANAVLIEHLKLENEGWARDATVPEPAEPSLEG